jgi:hypothetical protein
MPSWKKVILSGSDAALNSLNVTTAFTASGLIYPTIDGEDGQAIITDGDGLLSFQDIKVYAQVKNISGGTLQKGTPVHATASASPPPGNLVEVIAASASIASSMPATFVLDESLTNGQEGRAISVGNIGGVNTSGFTVGDIVYVGVNGGYTNIKPTGSTNLIQNLGIVTRVDAINGSGFIYGSGRSNDIPNIPQGFAWIGNANGVATAVATSSIQNVISSSFASTASFAVSSSRAVSSSNALTASHTTAINGTDNYIPRFTGTSALENSIIYDDNTQIGVATTAPIARLHIVGTGNTSGSLSLLTANSNGTGSFRVYDNGPISNPGFNTALFNESFGVNSLESLTPATPGLGQTTVVGAFGLRRALQTNRHTVLGYAAMAFSSGSATTGSIAIGTFALGFQQGGAFNIAIGANAMLGGSATAFNTGDRNLAIGAAALQRNTTGTRNNAIGDSSLTNNSVGSFNSTNGNRALTFNTSGSYNSAFGLDSLYTQTSASFNTGLGAQTFYDVTTGDSNTAAGYNTGRGVTTGRANTIIGANVTGLSSTLSNNIILADGDGNKKLIIDSTNLATLSGSLNVNGNATITGSLAVSQSLLQYSNNASITSGSTANVASFSTGSYTAGFFDYVATSGTNARAGTVFTVWNANNVEFTETSTNDIGSTSNLILSASLSAGAIRLQATSLTGTWSVKTLARMI